MSYPFSRAQARTATVSTALALRPPRAPARRAVPPTLRACSMYFASVARSVIASSDRQARRAQQFLDSEALRVI